MANTIASASTCIPAAPSMRYLQCAGQQALQRSAQAEAIRYLGAALELLRQLPESPERTREELMLLLTLGPAWMALRSYRAPEVEATYTHAIGRIGFAARRAPHSMLAKASTEVASSAEVASPKPRPGSSD